MIAVAMHRRSPGITKNAAPPSRALKKKRAAARRNTANFNHSVGLNPIVQASVLPRSFDHKQRPCHRPPIYGIPALVARNSPHTMDFYLYFPSITAPGAIWSFDRRESP